MVLPPRERRTLSGRFGVGFHTFAFLCICIGMFTNFWLQAEPKAYGTAMSNIGLWSQCFRSFTVTKDVHQETFFVGCRWIFNPFTTGYEDVREMLLTRGFGFISVIVFGAMGDNRDWMPHWDHNHLSWSFALGVVGVVAEFVAAVLFLVEYRIQKRKESYRRSHGVFTLEGKA